MRFIKAVLWLVGCLISLAGLILAFTYFWAGVVMFAAGVCITPASPLINFFAKFQNRYKEGPNRFALKVLPYLLPFSLLFTSMILIGASDKNTVNQSLITEAPELGNAERQAQKAAAAKAKDDERLMKAASEEKVEKEKIAATARLYAISFGQTAVKESLRDPDSVQWKWKAVNLDNGALCYLYRAKNGFGGYDEDGTVIHNGKAYNSTSQWNKLCGKSANYEEY
jgi:hypothetical protein